MLKMLSVLSQICLSHLGICFMIAFYLGSRWVSVPCISKLIRKGKISPHGLLGAPGEEKPYVSWAPWPDSRCSSTAPLFCRPCSSTEQKVMEGETKWASSEGLKHAIPLVISLSADLANSYNIWSRKGFFWCFCMFSIYCPAAGIWWDALIWSPFRALQSLHIFK